MPLGFAPDAGVGRKLIEGSLSKVAAGLVSATEIEAIRGRVLALATVPERPALKSGDYLAALAVFLWVVISTFPVVLPFVLFDDVGSAKGLVHEVWASREVASHGLGGTLPDGRILGNLPPEMRAAVQSRAALATIGRAASANCGRADRSPTTPFWISDVMTAVCAGAQSWARSSAMAPDCI